MDVDEILKNYTNELKPEINLNKLNLGDHQSRLPSLKHKWAGRYINHKRKLIKLKIKKKWFLYQKDLKNLKPFNQDNFSKFYSNIGLSTIGKITSLQINRTQDASENINEIEIIKNKSKNQNHSINTHINTYAKKGLPSKN